MKKKKLKKKIKKLEKEGQAIIDKTTEALNIHPCETCKWHGLTNSLADSPCFGCTVGDYKMYELKEN